MPRAASIVLVMTAAAGSLAPAAAAPADDAPQAPPAAIRTVAPDAAEAVLGSAIVDKAGKEIGRLVDVLVDANGVPQAGVIDFGGFLGVGARKVAVHWSTLHFTPGDGKHQIVLDMTPDEIKAAPAYTNPNKPAAVVTPATPVAGNADTPAQTEPPPH
jgi:hypothetical protein